VNRNIEKVVLIVGDSFVDENWLMSRGDTYHSYNVGKGHYISNLDKAESQIISFCGVAGILRMLHGPRERGSANLMRDRYRLVAVSAWNPADGDLPRCLLCDTGEAMKRLSPYRISGLSARTNEQQSNNSCPYTHDACTYESQMVNLAENTATQTTSSNRVVRLYEGFGSDQPSLQYRFDWRLDLRDKDKKPNIIEEITTAVENAKIEAVVLEDHGYGVVEQGLVEKLLKAYPDAAWYVRCKLDQPAWMEYLAKEKKVLRLLFTDEQLLEYSYGVRRWRHGSVLGRGALEVLGYLLGLPTWDTGVEVVRVAGKKVRSDKRRPEDEPLQAEHAALLFEDDTAIGASRIRDEQDATVINIAKDRGRRHAIRVGRSSVFFASLVYWDLMRSGLDDKLDHACEWALQNSYDWTESCTEGWLREQPANLSGPFDSAIYPEEPRR